MDRRTRESLCQEITRRYQELTVNNHKATLSENYELSIVQPNGIEVPKSGGQSQALSFAFIGSVIATKKNNRRADGLADIDLSVSELPIVCDSPFGAQGNLYQEKTIKYLPNIADQIITLVTDSQFEGEVEKGLEDITGQSHLIRNYPTEWKDKYQNESVEIEGKNYPYYEKSTTGFEYAKIIEVPHA